LTPQITKFTAKTLNRQAKKAQKDENLEKGRLKKVHTYRSVEAVWLTFANRHSNRATMKELGYTPPMPFGKSLNL